MMNATFNWFIVRSSINPMNKQRKYITVQHCHIFTKWGPCTKHLPIISTRTCSYRLHYQEKYLENDGSCRIYIIKAQQRQHLSYKVVGCFLHPQPTLFIIIMLSISPFCSCRSLNRRQDTCSKIDKVWQVQAVTQGTTVRHQLQSSPDQLDRYRLRKNTGM